MKATNTPICARAAIAVILFTACLMAACSEEETTYAYNAYSSYISGSLNTDEHDYRVKGSPILLSASGITSHSPADISFKWTITDAETHTAWGQIVKYKCPGTGAAFSFTLSASAYETYGASIAKSVTLIDSTFGLTVQNINIGASFTDPRDNQTYLYQRIGSLDWMTQNLNWRHPNVGKDYKDQSEYAIIFGRHYTWDEATSTENPLCPSGWRLPTNADWEDLGAALSGNAPVAFTTHWRNAGSNASADAKVNDNRLWPYDPRNTRTNALSWNALPAGKINAAGASTDNRRYGYWWSADAQSATSAYYRYIMYNNDMCYFNHGDKTGLFLSVRCVR
jgi:uncharacterized protein (TIGR02145 family)